jgi:hypothetical protein
MTTELQTLLDRLDGVKRKGNQWMALCPHHNDRRPSLSIGVRDNGKLLINCLAGCATEDVLVDLGLLGQPVILRVYMVMFQTAPSQTGLRCTGGRSSCDAPFGGVSRPAAGVAMNDQPTVVVSPIFTTGDRYV